ncbi:MAG: DUF1501 domain-containing protein [Planctomyces sp.]|nr:DUF1501 domain-containing protein [Planctomyces sp.]
MAVSRLLDASLTRRAAVQAGAVSLLGLAAADAQDLRSASDIPPDPTARSIIYIFLSGGLAQHESFDPKPLAPAEVRGEFQPISTATPGLFIIEHLPLLAARSQQWSLVRSLTHPTNDHSLGHAYMLSGRSQPPPRFDPNRPLPEDWPALASIVGDQTRPRNNLPPAVVLPERLIHRTGRVIPGQFAGQMGARRDPWFIEASPFNSETYGAFPEYEFHHANGRCRTAALRFQAPFVQVPHELLNGRLPRRLDLLSHLDAERRVLDAAARIEEYRRSQEAAVSLLTSSRVATAMDVTEADAAVQDRYGRNAFGWSLLMARRLVEAGVNFVQVNLGNNETWDTHGNAFPHLKDVLLPPTDRAVAALLDDLAESGQLESTLLVMAGEFGRTPKISLLPQHYALPGRDHWGAVQSVWLAGGGIAGGRVIGASDRMGAYPISEPQRPENLAATIYRSLGIPDVATWSDDLGRPHAVYHGEPIPGLS